MTSKTSRDDIIIRVGPYNYIHVLDSNTNVARVVLGPSIYTRPDHGTFIPTGSNITRLIF